MGRLVAPLNDRRVKAAKPKEKVYRLSNGNGLILEVKPNGTKVWHVRYTFKKKAKMYTIGEYHSYRLPLAKRLVEILQEMQNISKWRSQYVFCSLLEFAKRISNNMLNQAHKRLGINDHNAHGWRSSFSTICYEKQREHGFSADVIEAQLCHQIGNSVVRAYMRGDFLEERRELLEWWEGLVKNY